MRAEELKKRTELFGLQVIRLVEGLPTTKAADVIARQILRSATSIGANYRAACRARSRAEFTSKIQIAEEEADESAYWLSLLLKANVANGAGTRALFKEAEELTAIFSASARTAKRNVG